MSEAPAPDTAMVPAVPQVVALAAPVAQLVQQWQDYQQLTRDLLDDSDYQRIGSKQFKKKSAWRKYARAFNISDRVTFEEIVRDVDGYPLYARIRVEAVHEGSGRRAEADHECHVKERCCPAADGLPCDKREWNSHRCCLSGCTGRIHFSHPGDIPATATTRAKNRAISDLIGAGEVSAEEMEGSRGDAIEGDYRVTSDTPNGASGEPDPYAGVTCGVCNGGGYDNRRDKRSDQAPDFKCKRGDGSGWIQRDGSVKWAQTAQRRGG